MAEKRRQCNTDPDKFCYVCGRYIPTPINRRLITPRIQSLYLKYFGVELGDQTRNWAPHRICRPCELDLLEWGKAKKKTSSFRHGYDLEVAKKPHNRLLLLSF